MNRRTLLKCLCAAAASPLAAALPVSGVAIAKTGAMSVEDLQKNWKTFLPAGAADPTPPAPLKLADHEWKQRLSSAQFDVLRHEGTEYPGTSPLNHEKR